MQSRLMLASLFVVVLTVLLGCSPSTEAASTERPYQFGFTIEKQQHRQEKKDERGIVMGEFGFITADGIYHVTVYATDEEGKFRILAMRSYPYEEHPKTIEMVVRPKPKPTTPTTTSQPKPLEKHNFSVQGCSGCFIKNNAPTTTQKPADKKYDISLLSRPLAPEQTPRIGSAPPSNSLSGGKAQTPTSGAFGSANSPQAPAKTGTNAVSKTTSNQPVGGAKGSTNSIPIPSTQITPPALGGGSIGGGKGNTQGAAKQPGTNTGFGSGTGGTGSKGFGGNNNVGGNSGSGAVSGSTAGNAAGFGGSAGGKSGNAAGFGGSSGGKTGNVAGFDGSKTGSAAGEAGDLYRFKYLLDYNGHRETGSRSGNKEGSFYAIGDDNVERTIEYIANEFGYQPRVRFRKLDAPVPAKENTLKDYEFVWFKKQ